MQAKPSSSQAGQFEDPLEREANEIAERLVGRQEPPGSGTAISSVPLRRATPGRGAGRPETELSGRGRPLSAELRASLEPRFGYDFGHVRVHDRSTDRAFAEQLGARAFTHRHHIWLGPRESDADRMLMAHELTHVLQQGTGTRRAVGTAPVAVTKTGPKVQKLSFSGLLEKVASYIPGYNLIVLILGRSPITGKAVQRTGLKLLEAALGLIPVLGPVWFEQLKKAKVAEKAGSWLDGEFKKLGITWSGIEKLLEEFRSRAHWLAVWKNKSLIQEIFGPTWNRILRFLGNAKAKLKELILEGALRLAGSASQKVLAVFQKSRKVFTKIVDDPGQFITNFLNAIGQGFGRFGKNLGKHLKGAVFGWLMGTVSSGGINLPQKLDARGVFGLVMEVLGLTYDNVKAKLTKKLGPKAAKVIELLERSLGFFGEFAKKGPAALWEKVQQSLGNLRDLVIGKIRDWVVVRVVGAAVTRLLAMMNPAGALFTVAQAIYKTVMFFIDRWEQIKSLVVSIFGSIHDIAFGKLQKASEYIEKTLATGMTLAISFMARFLGLGGIGKKIQELVQTVRRPVNRALDKLISWLVKKGKALWGKAKATASRLKGKLVAWWKTTRVFKSRKGKNHKLFYRRKGRRAILMVASKETPVNSKNRKSAGGKAGAGLLPEPEQRRADALASELESQPASEQGTQSPAGTASRKRAESEVQGLMESSLDEGGAGQGTEQDPVLINWYKTAEAYAKIRVESTGGKVTMYSIDGGTSLAVPNPARGGDYSLKVDTDNLNPPSTSWLVGARKASKSHSERINQSLKQVGSVEDAGGTQLRSEEAKVHVDHIRDQALAEGAGVRDETRNAWYLTAAKNRAANATQKQYVLYKGAVSSLGDILTDKPHVVVDGTASIPGGGTPIGPGASMDEPYLGAQASQGLESLSDQDKFQGTAGDPVRIKWWKRPSDYVSIDQKQVSGGLPPAIMPDPNYLNPTGISWKVEGDTESKTLFSSRFNRKVRAKLGVKRDRDIPIVEVSLEYGGSRIQPDRDEELYEIDHVRDRALGGKDGPKNVWPIPKTNHDKVRANVEQYVLFRGKSVKAGQLKGPVHVKVHSRPGLPSSSAVNTEDSPVGYQKVRGQWQRRS